MLLETIQNVVNKGEYGGKHDVVVTNLDLTHVFLKWKQYEEDVRSFAKAVSRSMNLSWQMLETCHSGRI